MPRNSSRASTSVTSYKCEGAPQDELVQGDTAVQQLWTAHIVVGDEPTAGNTHSLRVRPVATGCQPHVGTIKKPH